MITVRDIRIAIDGLPDDMEVATDLTMDTCSAFNDGLSAEVVGLSRNGMSLTFDVSAEIAGCYDDPGFDEAMDGDHESALRDAGLGTDEDYGYFGDD